MNIFDEVRRDLRAILLPMCGQDIPLAVIETIEALWAEERRPQIHAKQKTANGYTFTVALPAGVSFADFCAKQNYFKDHAGGNRVNVSVTQSGRMAILSITTNILKDFFTYPIDYERNGILPVPIGYSVDRLEVIDLAAHEHILIGGETGSGKTTCLNVIIYSLLSLPEPPIIILIDLKCSGDYSWLEERIMLITDRGEACQALERLLQETYSRQKILKQSRCRDIQHYNRVGGKMQYIVLIIDELAQLKNKDAQADLEDLLALSRAGGTRIICATQRPSAKIFQAKSFGDAKANFTLTLCFKTRSRVDSQVIMDSGEAANLPDIPGRAILRRGCTLTEIQVPYFDTEGVPQVDQFSPAGIPTQQQVNRDSDRMGLLRHGPNSSAAVSLIARCTKTLTGLVRGRED